MEIVKGKYGYNISLTVKDKLDNVVDLTGVTRVVLNIADIKNNRNVMAGECSEVDYSTGKVKYTVQPDDVTFSAGVYVGSVQLVYSTKDVETKQFYVTVREKLSI